MAITHPRDALYAGKHNLPVLPPVEHFAGSEKLIGKSLQLQAEMAGAFDLTCDCEDGAAAGSEAEHAAMIVRLLSAAPLPHRVGVRIHDIQHASWRADVDQLLEGLAPHLAYVVLPKCQSARDVAQMADYIELRASRSRGTRLPVHVLIETHGALHEVWPIAGLPAVETLDFGLMDFVSAHHGAIPDSAMKSPGQFEHPLVARAKCEIAAAALAHGKVPSHNVTLDIKNPDTAYADARTAHERFGYLRMWSVHPTQIDPIRRALSPAAAAVSKAAAVLLAAQDADWGPIQHEGELYDRASYRYCWQVLERAERAGASLPATARQRFFA